MHTSVKLESILLGVAIFLGYTFAAGGVDPRGRMVTLGLVALAALAALRNLREVPVRLSLFLPGLAAAASLVTAIVPGMGYEMTIQLIFYALAANVLLAEAESDSLAISLVFAAAGLSASILVEALGGTLLIGRSGLGLGAAGFLAGAGVSSVALAAVLPVLWERRERFPRSILIGLALIFVSAIILTESRTGLVALALGMSWSFVRMTAAARRIALIALAAILCAVAMLFLPKFLDRLDPSYITNAQRLSMIRGVGAAFLDRPLSGFGPWSFPVLGQMWLEWPKWELHPHSLLLRTAFESGIIGVLAWSGLLISVALGVRRGPRPTWTPGILLAILGGSITDDMFWIPALAFLFFIAAAACVADSAYRIAPAIAGLLIIVSGFGAAVLPMMHDLRPGLPLEPITHHLDDAVRSNTAPKYRGAEHDVFALRISGYALLSIGDTPGAIATFRRAFERDPHLILGPHALDLAWTFLASGSFVEAAKMISATREIAPVLAAWFMNETIPVDPSYVDRHYGIEFPDPFVITPLMLKPDGDRLSWRHYRYEGARALVDGDTRRARTILEKAHALALQQYGADAVLCRLYAMAAPEHAADLIARAERRRGPVLPYRVFAPLMYRHRIFSSGDNSPWWTKIRITAPVTATDSASQSFADVFGAGMTEKVAKPEIETGDTGSTR